MTQTFNSIIVIGGGAWGTALAQVFATSGRKVTLYARDNGLAAEIKAQRENKKYLQGITLSADMMTTADIAAAKNADIVLMATPAQFVRETLKKLSPYVRAGVPLVNSAKGIEIATGKILSEVAAELMPQNPYAALSGPTFAHEVAKGLPTAITLASVLEKGRLQALAEFLRGKTFRPYISHDPVGADIAGAIKNVIAIACGIVEGKKLGQNAKAAVMTRGMAEIKRCGLAKGATSETFLGLSGIGDLMLTCHSMSSRNFSLGFELGSGKSLDDILSSRQSVAEGVSTAKALAAAAQKMKLDMPICTAVDHILHNKADVNEIVTGLLSRDLKEETD